VGIFRVKLNYFCASTFFANVASRGIADAAFDEAATGRNRRAVPEAEIVDDDDMVARRLGELGDDGADVAGSSCNEQSHVLS